MNEFTHLIVKKLEILEEKIPGIRRLQNETKSLTKLLKKGKNQKTEIFDIHSLINLAKERVERLKEDEGIEALQKTNPEIELQDETKILFNLITKGRFHDSNMLDVHSLIKLAKEKVKQLNDSGNEPI